VGGLGLADRVDGELAKQDFEVEGVEGNAGIVEEVDGKRKN